MNQVQMVALAVRGRMEEIGSAIAPSKRRMEVLYYLIAEGKTCREIAGAMVISENTVEVHLMHARLGLKYDGTREMTRDLERRYFRLEAIAALEASAVA